MLARIVPVIMCGGTGTRLWPVSRESMPKQFVTIVGSTSTFQQVLARVNDAEGWWQGRRAALNSRIVALIRVNS